MSSSLRVLGQAQESVALLRAERAAGSDELDDAVSGFLALALADAGAEREAVSVALAALGPHVLAVSARAGQLRPAAHRARGRRPGPARMSARAARA